MYCSGLYRKGLGRSGRCSRRGNLLKVISWTYSRSANDGSRDLQPE
jgi:hypothetical protein